MQTLVDFGTARSRSLKRGLRLAKAALPGLQKIQAWRRATFLAPFAVERANLACAVRAAGRSIDGII